MCVFESNICDSGLVDVGVGGRMDLKAMIVAIYQG